MGFAGYLASMGDIKTGHHGAFISESLKRRGYFSSRRKWTDNIKMDLKLICDGFNWLRVGSSD
jgi:hypothetical protein